MENSLFGEKKEIFEFLYDIKKVEPDKNLYFKILNKVNKQKIIPLFWVKSIAFLLIIMISIEFYFLSRQTSQTKADISNLFYKINTITYYE